MTATERKQREKRTLVFVLGIFGLLGTISWAAAEFAPVVMPLIWITWFYIIGVMLFMHDFWSVPLRSFLTKGKSPVSNYGPMPF